MEESQDLAQTSAEPATITGESSKVHYNTARKSIKSIAAYVKDLIEMTKNAEENDIINKGEMIANVTLAYRCLEDASMRLGKAIQATDGGESVYDKDSTVGVK